MAGEASSAPRMISAASPGTRWIIRKASTETPKATKASSSSRRRIAEVIWPPLLAQRRLPQVPQAARGHRLEALDLAAHRGEQGAVGEVHHRPGAGQDALRLLVVGAAAFTVRLGAALAQQLVQLGGAVSLDFGGATWLES